MTEFVHEGYGTLFVCYQSPGFFSRLYDKFSCSNISMPAVLLPTQTNLINREWCCSSVGIWSKRLAKLLAEHQLLAVLLLPRVSMNKATLLATLANYMLCLTNDLAKPRGGTTGSIRSSELLHVWSPETACILDL